MPVNIIDAMSMPDVTLYANRMEIDSIMYEGKDDLYKITYVNGIESYHTSDYKVLAFIPLDIGGE